MGPLHVLVLTLCCISCTLPTRSEDEVPGFTCLRDTVGSRYKGSIRRTKNNEECATWKSIMDDPAYTDTIKRNIKVIYDSWPDYEKLSSKCRNPDQNPSGPWCFTKRSSNNAAVESCQIPLCRTAPNIDCLQHERGLCYRGSKNQVILFDGTEDTCSPWNTVMEFNGPKLNNIVEDIQHVFRNWSNAEKESNVCRNPDRRSDGPWCFVYENGTYGPYASVEACHIPLCNIQPGRTCFIDQVGFYYRGPHNLTKDGEPCLTWSSIMEDTAFEDHPIVEKIKHEYASWSHEEQRSNACKNPDRRKHGPWCFVQTDGSLEQVTCEFQLPECPEIKPRDLRIKMIPRVMTMKGQVVRVTCSAYIGEKCDLEAKGAITFQLYINGKKKDMHDAHMGQHEYDKVSKRISLQIVFAAGEHLAGATVVCATRMASYESSIETNPLQFRAIRVINSSSAEEAVQDKASYSGQKPVETLVNEMEASDSVEKETSNDRRNQTRFDASAVDSADTFHPVRSVANVFLYLIIVVVVGRE